ncbi:hypothetical protein M514_15257 [Trichuris suis]|uniref:Uncharacterized protein n=1 Tax=Trichuris suis TaxID=68888 RepID=A0A085NSH5_9BILA|nr:hypothetical protein M514_15257 [Trichuris suis]
MSAMSSEYLQSTERLCRRVKPEQFTRNGSPLPSSTQPTERPEEEVENRDKVANRYVLRLQLGGIGAYDGGLAANTTTSVVATSSSLLTTRESVVPPLSTFGTLAE